jgi:hypothetical protein
MDGLFLFVTVKLSVNHVRVVIHTFESRVDFYAFFITSVIVGFSRFFAPRPYICHSRPWTITHGQDLPPWMKKKRWFLHLLKVHGDVHSPATTTWFAASENLEVLNGDLDWRRVYSWYSWLCWRISRCLGFLHSLTLQDWCKLSCRCLSFPPNYLAEFLSAWSCGRW